MTAKNGADRRRETVATSMVELCSVRVDTAHYAVPISHILEIVGNAIPRTVPLAPGFVGGLVHYRGDVLTTVSLREVLGMAPFGQAQDIIVLESRGGCFGLLVDSVGEVLTVPAASHEPNPSTLDESRRVLFNGTYKLKDSLLVMLDPEQLDPMRLSSAQATQ